jgi:prevent-host-death family protein
MYRHFWRMDMKIIGAFDAKTHFSRLLRDVEEGETYEIRRRGKAVAKLTSTREGRDEGEIQELLTFFRGVRKHAHATAAEIADWMQEGRR